MRDKIADGFGQSRGAPEIQSPRRPRRVRAAGYRLPRQMYDEVGPHAFDDGSNARRIGQIERHQRAGRLVENLETRR